MRRSKITFIKVSHRTSTIATHDDIDVDEKKMTDLTNDIDDEMMMTALPRCYVFSHFWSWWPSTLL